LRARGAFGSAEKRNAYDNARKSRSSSSGDYNSEQDWGATKETDIETELNQTAAHAGSLIGDRGLMERSRQLLRSLDLDRARLAESEFDLMAGKTGAI